MQNNKITWKKPIVAQKSSDRLKVRLNWLKKTKMIDVAVLGLAACHLRKKMTGRYMTKAPLRHITMERQCLRWWMTAEPCIHPCKSKVDVLHLFRWFTHTHTLPQEGGKLRPGP